MVKLINGSWAQTTAELLNNLLINNSDIDNSNKELLNEILIAIKDIKVEVPVEVIVEKEVEIIKEVEVIKEVIKKIPVFIIKEVVVYKDKTIGEWVPVSPESIWLVKLNRFGVKYYKMKGGNMYEKIYTEAEYLDKTGRRSIRGFHNPKFS